MAPAPIILVPGFWLGAWAWDDVAGRLRMAGHSVHALTLPGLEPGASAADRANVHLSDHIDAIQAAVEAAPGKPVLVLHSATGFSGYAVSDRIPDRIAAIVYVAWIGLLAGAAVTAALALQAVRLGLGRLAMHLPGEIAALLITLAGLLGTIGLALGFLLFAVYSLEHLRSGARRGRFGKRLLHLAYVLGGISLLSLATWGLLAPR